MCLLLLLLEDGGKGWRMRNVSLPGRVHGVVDVVNAHHSSGLNMGNARGTAVMVVDSCCCCPLGF